MYESSELFHYVYFINNLNSFNIGTKRNKVFNSSNISLKKEICYDMQTFYLENISVYFNLCRYYSCVCNNMTEIQK